MANSNSSLRVSSDVLVTFSDLHPKPEPNKHHSLRPMNSWISTLPHPIPPCDCSQLLWHAATPPSYPGFFCSAGPPLLPVSLLPSCTNCWDSEPWEAVANKRLALFYRRRRWKKERFLFLRQMKESPRKRVFDPPTCFSKLPFLKAPPKEVFMNAKWSLCQCLLQKKGKLGFYIQYFL
jgi:hypothetical protein